MGKAPLTNAAKAPGLWQKMKISFKAPKFDAARKKIANARFVSVELNGIQIYDNVEVPLPTGGPVENNEGANHAAGRSWARCVQKYQIPPDERRGYFAEQYQLQNLLRKFQIWQV
jgi:hypothetical protein